MDGLPGTRNRRTAILTPGPNNASYFEHTYIARYLGALLLEGEDIMVRDGAVMVRTIEGPQPLGTLWRRVDADYMDPLELQEDSQLGTPGLVNAVRLGNVNLINALGSGVLEMRALMAFLPKISKVLTGQALRLPNIATWWCGQPKERAYVKENASRMILARPRRWAARSVPAPRPRSTPGSMRRGHFWSGRNWSPCPPRRPGATACWCRIR
jgi:uncharacterized circularly permuted ATP-grasp superfamily protein